MSLYSDCFCSHCWSFFLFASVVACQVHSATRQPVQEKRREESKEREKEEKGEVAGAGGEGQRGEGVHQDLHQLAEGQR